jgi:hypothetical protein
MRCQCCNRNLSDYESTLRHPTEGHYLDICTKCLVDIPIEPVEANNRFNDIGYDDDNSDDLFDDGNTDYRIVEKSDED